MESARRRYRSMLIERISDSVLIVSDESGKTIIEKRMKKDAKASKMLFDFISVFTDMGYAEGMRFGFASHRIESISTNKGIAVVAIRVKGTLWRVVCYRSDERKALVIVDAFENHKAKAFSDVLARNESTIRRIDAMMTK